MINGEPDLEVVATSGGGENTLLKARKLKPRIILMDLGLRHEGGLRLAKALRREIPKSNIIGMGLLPLQEDIIEFVEAGASGFILKDATIDDFLETIRTVANGTNVLPPSLAGSLFSHVVKHALKRGERKLAQAVRMTKREREIVTLIAEGLSNKAIAHRLGIATYTVKSHVHNILDKLALHSRLQISSYIHDEEAF